MHGAANEFAAVAGDPYADCRHIRPYRNFGDEAPQRFGRLAQDRPRPNTKQFPIGADECQFDRDGSDVDPQGMGHNDLAMPKHR
jgi:hypothetical protein